MMQQQDPEQTRNTIAAIALSVAVLLAWQLLYAGPKYEEQKRLQQQRQQQETSNATGVQGPQAGPAGTPAPNVAPNRLRIALTRDAALATTKRVPIETPSIIGSINLKGGRIDDITLVKYHEQPDPKSPRVILFSPDNSPQPYFAEFNWRAPAGAKTTLPGSDTVWTVSSGDRLTPNQPLELSWTNDAGLTFKRKISIDKDYLFTVVDTVENNTGEAVALFPSGAIYRYGVPTIEGFFIQHEGLIGVLGEGGFTEVTYSELAEENSRKTFENVTGGWLGFTDKYWASALIPDQSKPFNATLDDLTPPDTPRSSRQFISNFASQAISIAPGGQASHQNRLYVGAKKVEIIQSYEAQFGIRQFELMIDWGWFYFITKPLHGLLNWLYGLLGNFGFAILAVTVIVKAAFFWFANKSYESMAKMKKLQPEMEKIRARYKDDKMEQQKQLMELYKNEKINPLAGCLPILIQIPVFFALYKVLFISIDMRHAPFVGWISDLSAPDPTTIFNLFGLLPYTLPDWFPILGIWPLLMGITMWLQMQLNPQQPDPIQQQVFNWMPVLFTFLLASFPAGLVIYWAWNNVLSLAQQYIIMKRQGVDIPLMENLQRTLGAAAALPDKIRGRGKAERNE
ncbi:MAG: membrane protein insertase YidC [Pseudomonadota bacterium]